VAIAGYRTRYGVGTWFGELEKWLILVPPSGVGLYLLFGIQTHFLPASV